MAVIQTTLPNTTQQYNPYAQTAPSTTAGDLANNMAAAPQVSTQSTAGQVAQVNPQTGLTPAATSTASTYDPTTASGTHWNVDNSQTVQGQLAGIIDSNSPLMQRAVAKSNESMNARGLLNSSMAVGAGQAALYDAAMPIATQDASTYGNAAKYNADTDTNTSQFNANANNAAGQFNAQAKTDVSSRNAAAANALQSQLVDNSFKGQLANQAATNDALQADQKNSLTAQLANQNAAVQQSATRYDGALKIAMQNADAAGKLQLQQIDASTRTTIENIDAQYKNQLQTSASMADTYRTMIDNISQIMANKDLDAAGKQAAINNVTKLYNGALQVQQNISGLQLGNLLNPSDFSTSSPGGSSSQPNVPSPADNPWTGYTGGGA